jgi:DNA-binding Lrp family transcriptional regulator
MNARLDDLDRHLLSLLKIARTTVVARIARLEREGVVAGYGVRLGQKLEHAAVRAICGISVNAKSAPGVIRALERVPEVEELSAVSGQFDYVVFLRCDTPEKLDVLLDHVGQLDGINQTQTSIVLSQKIDRRSAVPAVS